MEDSPENISPSSDYPRRRSTRSRWRPRSISGVDGSTSRLPSSSVASVTTVHFATRRNMKEPYSSAPVTPNMYMDPPRPAKEGHEWVWFPAGYWAEREIVESPSKVMKHFKWRTRSGKSSSGRDTQDDREHTPNNLWAQASLPLPNPFHAEETYAQSLQQRPLFHRHGTSSESGGSSFPLNRSLQTPMPSPYLTEEALVQSLQRSPLGNQNSDSGASHGTSPHLQLTPRPLQTSPLKTTKGDSDSVTPIAISENQPTITPTVSLSSFSPLTPASQEGKPKKSFIARFFPDHKPKIKKSHTDNQLNARDYTASTIEGARVELMRHSHSATPPIMSRVASLLREEVIRKPRGSRSLKLFGKSPWYRKASAGSDTSISSSVLDVLRGPTPVTSPVCDIEQPNLFCVEFPGGEATRLKTPPLRESGQHRDRPRSFFFDISMPPLRASSSKELDESSRSPPRSVIRNNEKLKTQQEIRKSKRDSSKEWWEVPIAVPRYEAMAPSSFEFDMPEHLPNSPMCPTNKKHKSGGTGVCVYHGRRKRSGEYESVDDDNNGDVWT
ncbi:hypothetical protein F5Y06DRAFT_235181 [Hypoxylon sp. FL0890]|nr:hypothetical protein F5Y06DRAFT_235181 [Hypoxylon sp. FL0890]